MSAGPMNTGGGGRRGRGGSSQDVEINITPIIDFFVVLIAFLLLSASFLAVGILDAGIAAGSLSSKKQTPPAVKVEVMLKQNQMIRIKITGKQNRTVNLKANNKTWDLDGMTHQLRSIRRQFPKVNGITLAAQNQVEYENLIRTMAEARKTMPNVLLGGF